MSLHIFGGLESVRFFADNKESTVPFTGHKHLEYGGKAFWDTIKKMQASGSGAFITVNGTDGVGAKAENIVRVRTYYVDIDGLEDKGPALEKLITAPLKPSAIVETKNGVHAYWYSKNQIPVDHKEYRRVQTGLVKFFGGDMSARDISRVLRIPDTWHLKDPDNPYLVRIVHQLPESKTPYYSASELLEVYPAPREREGNPVIAKKKSPKSWRAFLEGLERWDPIPGERNQVMLLSAGVAIAFGVSEEDFVDTMQPIVSTWGTGRNVRAELVRVGKWAYEKGTPIHPRVLQKKGVPVKGGL